MPEAFIRELARRAPKHEEVLMTIAQKLEQKGMQKGIEQGRKETTLALARQLLLNGVERQVIKRATGLSDQVLDAL